jgi:MoaA/NifB/PqqE/SkfB family radical SAM enzyme
MGKVIAIDNDIQNPYSFEVTWDLGLRCNYDCTYCPSHRHNNTSSHASLETLIKTSKFVFDYKKLMQSQMTFNRKWNIGFTGGEPTNNPNFLQMCEYIHSQDDPDMLVDVTTNGSFSQKYCEKLIETVDSITVSYHCEAKQKVKDNVVNRIYQIAESGIKYKVNLMIHAKPEYFDECMTLVDRFTDDNIKFVPRIIGESYEDSKYVHRYTPEQHAWFRNYWANKNKKVSKPDANKDAEYEYKDDQNKVQEKKKIVEQPKKEKTVSQLLQEGFEKEQKEDEPKKEQKVNTRKALGRPCCGQRTFYTLDESNYKKDNTKLDTKDWKASVFACSTEYKEWSCMINWNWLHIEQEYNKILHHQTCRANFGGRKGEIGTITECDQIINKLEKQFATGTMPVITCPNKVCGCGLCVPKAQHHDITEAMFKKSVKNLTPVIGGTMNV